MYPSKETDQSSLLATWNVIFESVLLAPKEMSAKTIQFLFIEVV